ncbi:MAG: phospholipase D-like domain-containing protein [Cyclobacteriaceae bacterium]
MTLVEGGEQYFNQILHLIASAKETLYLQTYIYKEDATGQMVTNALINAAQRGVQVYLMVDGYASQGLSRSFLHKLRVGGIKFKYFEPLFRSRAFYLGRRLHHKLVVADASFALVGGINISDNYNELPGNPAWLDYALNVEGEVAIELLELCQKTWNGFQPLKKLPPKKSFPNFLIPPDSRKYVRMRRNDWVRRKNEVSQSYLEIFNEANTEVVILCSYFLPGGIFRRAIRKARERGVTVFVIVAGISDVRVAKQAERFMYEWLLKQGVRIYEYNKVVLHGKLALCDRQWLTLGSFNLNDISTYASVELNLDVKDEEFTSEVRAYLEKDVISECTEISIEYLSQNTTIMKRFLRWISFVSFRILFFFFTFYFKQVDETSPSNQNQ